MATPKLNYDRVARILVDAVELGDQAAAKKWKLSERSIRNYRTTLDKDDKLQEAFRKLAAVFQIRWEHERHQAELGWRLEAHKTLRAGLEVQRKLFARAVTLAETADDVKLVTKVIAEVSKAVARMGELDVAREALGVSSVDHQSGTPTSAPANGDASEAGGSAASDGGSPSSDE